MNGAAHRMRRSPRPDLSSPPAVRLHRPWHAHPASRRAPRHGRAAPLIGNNRSRTPTARSPLTRSSAQTGCSGPGWENAAGGPRGDCPHLQRAGPAKRGAPLAATTLPSGHGAPQGRQAPLLTAAAIGRLKGRRRTPPISGPRCCQGERACSPWRRPAGGRRLGAQRPDRERRREIVGTTWPHPRPYGAPADPRIDATPGAVEGAMTPQRRHKGARRPGQGSIGGDRHLKNW
jgi:hypothetical protein